MIYDGIVPSSDEIIIRTEKIEQFAEIVQGSSRKIEPILRRIQYTQIIQKTDADLEIIHTSKRREGI